MELIIMEAACDSFFWSWPAAPRCLATSRAWSSNSIQPCRPHYWLVMVISQEKTNIIHVMSTPPHKKQMSMNRFPADKCKFCFSQRTCTSFFLNPVIRWNFASAAARAPCVRSLTLLVHQCNVFLLCYLLNGWSKPHLPEANEDWQNVSNSDTPKCLSGYKKIGKDVLGCCCTPCRRAQTLWYKNKGKW